MAQVINVTIDDHSEEVIAQMKEKVNDWLDAIGQDAASTAANKAPVDTSNLKNSISHAVVEDEQAVYIGTNVPYAIYHEFGTGEFAEGGSKAKKIPWAFKDKDGKWHYTKGVKARHFIQFGATAHASEYRERLERILEEE